MSPERGANEESLDEIQIKLAFLERANSDLSDVVYRQQQEIRLLAARIKEVSDRPRQRPIRGAPTAAGGGEAAALLSAVTSSMTSLPRHLGR